MRGDHWFLRLWGGHLHQLCGCHLKIDIKYFRNSLHFSLAIPLGFPCKFYVIAH
jgi:hypothetical protein